MAEQQDQQQQAILLERLQEKELSLERFLKVGPDKAAFEADFQNKPYGPADLASDKPCFCKYCQGKQPHKRWGILGKDFLVLVDTDKKEMYDLLSKVLPETFEVTSPRRGLPHKYFCVCGEQVPNKTLYIEGDVDEKGRPNGAGEVRANNEYLVAPGTVIAYKDKLTGEEKTGMYLVSKNVPIARLEYSDFMAAVKPYFGKNQSQTITPEEMANGVSAGMRHAKGIRYACHLIGKAKLDAETAFFEMQRWNQLNNPPMDEKDLKRQVRDACRYIAEQNQIPIEQVIGCGGIKNPIFKELDADEKKEVSPSLTCEERFKNFIEAKENVDFKTIYEGDYKKYFGKRKKADSYLVCTLLKNSFNIDETRKLMDGSKNTDWTNENFSLEEQEAYRDETIDAAQENMGKGKKAAPQADRLVQLCEGEKVELFHDQYSTAFAHFSMPCDTAISCDKNDVRNLLSVSNTKISSPTHGEPSLTKLGKEEKYVKRNQIKDYNSRKNRK